MQIRVAILKIKGVSYIISILYRQPLQPNGNQDDFVAPLAIICRLRFNAAPQLVKKDINGPAGFRQLR